MAEAIYKVGDILEFTEVVLRQFGLWAGPVRGLIVKISDPGYEYLSYRLLLSGPMDDTKNMTLHWFFEKNIVSAAKRVGHVDISALMFMENDEPDYEKMMAAYACVESANLRKLNAELIKKLNEKADQVCQLGKENEDFRISNKELSESLSNSEMKAHSRLNEISFLTRKVNELESVNNDLKTENEPLKMENEELRAANKKLAEANARYLQSMTCAKKQMTEAAKRICEAEEHIDVAVCNS